MLNLQQVLKQQNDWSGSLDQLAAKASSLCAEHPVSADTFLPPTSRSLVIDYRSERIISAADGKKFQWRHLVQLIAARHLAYRGWKRQAIAIFIASHSTQFLLDHLERLHEDTPLEISPSDGMGATGHADDFLEDASIAVQLLARGLVEQYKSARQGTPLVHDASLNASLSQAMLSLASLHLRNGTEDITGSVHQLVARCRLPLASRHWGLAIFDDENFPYREMRLLDEDRRLPTLDCVELARQTHSELDLREQMAFEALRSISEQFIGKAEKAYSDLRLWVAEHPVTTSQGMRAFERDKGLQLAASFLVSCYEAVQPHHLVDGKLYTCPGCRSPLRRARVDRAKLACTLPQCAAFEKPVDTLEHRWGSDTLVALPHILVYWVGPAIDECLVYRTAVEEGHEPRIYPGRDACDVSLDGNTTGIDIKSYASPFLLATRLTKSIQGLAIFQKRIVAVNDQAISRFQGYLDILRREYRGPQVIQFISVSQLLKTLKRPF